MSSSMILLGAANGSTEEEGRRRKDLKNLASLLDAARPFLRDELEKTDPKIPELLSMVRAAGTGERHHKNGTYLEHLLHFYRVIKLWGAPRDVALCGLVHSSYANAYINVSIFDQGTSRETVQGLVGAPIERIVFLFCSVSRKKVLHEGLLYHYTEEELTDHLAASAESVRCRATAAAAAFVVDTTTTSSDEPWRRKLCSLLPAQGIEARHFKTGEPLRVSRRMVALILLMTIIDIADQFMDYQDKLYENGNGRMEMSGDGWGALWPGSVEPGLWMNLASRMGALYTLILREEELYMMQQRGRRSNNGDQEKRRDDEEMELVIPPVFNYCTQVLDPREQEIARDLYCEAVRCDDWKDRDWNRVEEILLESINKNPFVGEPHLVLAQVYLNLERYAAAEIEAEQGLKLLLEWGVSWDKRMSWEAWVSWGRVMLDKAKDKEWPRNEPGITTLGNVK